ncbi:MAG: MauE/DoxX family redox-associated membrane protein [Actinomycetes bacterium]
MDTVLLTALSLFLFITLFFPAVTKIKRRPILVAYYSELLEVDVKVVRLALFVTCIAESILAFGILFRIIPVITGTITLSLLLAFLGFRILILCRSRGRASCGTDPRRPSPHRKVLALWWAR